MIAIYQDLWKHIDVYSIHGIQTHETFPLHAGMQKARARAKRLAAAADPGHHGHPGLRATDPHGLRATDPHGLDMRRLRPGKRSTR